MGGKIVEVYPGSIAENLGLKPGDEILSINGKDLTDIFDFQFLIQESYIEITVRHNDKIKIYEVEKLPEEALGIQFESPIFDNIKKCQNSCIFCFIDQLPKGLRPSLYLKDDDYRLSFLYGNYITLTNIKKEELNRIVAYRLSPLYISVHSTLDDVRLKLVRNRKTLTLIEKLRFLIENGIKVNVQIVLIPEINDGKILEKTILDLFTLQEGILSVAIVPVGLTKYRSGLYPIRRFRKEEIVKTIQLIDKFQEKFRREIGRGFVYLADEFYLDADMPLPNIEYYDTLSQIEDGIGMSRWFIDEMRRAIREIGASPSKGEIGIITGVLGKKVWHMLTDELSKAFPYMNFSMIEVKNKFFGEDITITGLLTARDILNRLYKIGKKFDKIFLPNIVLNDQERFIDDMQVEKFLNLANMPVDIVDIHPEDFLKKLLAEKKQ